MRIAFSIIVLCVSSWSYSQETNLLTKLASNKYVRQAHIDFNQGEFGAAVNTATQGLELGYDNHSFILNALIGYSYVHLDNYDLALSYLEKAKAVEKYGSQQERVHLYWGFGDCHAKLNDLEQAIRYFEIALDIDPKHEETRVNLGKYLTDNDQPSEALIYLESLLENRTEYEPMVRLSRAFALLKLQRFEEAKADLDICVRLDPTNPYVYNKLSDYYHLTYQDEKFCQALDKAISLDHTPFGYEKDRLALIEKRKQFCPE